MISKIKSFIFSPCSRFKYLAKLGFLNWMNDEKFLKRKWKLKFGTELDLDDPETFNEKIQWLKLYDRKDIYTKMVDKHEVKKYVADKIGEEYIIPVLATYDNFDDVDFDRLPDQL